MKNTSKNKAEKSGSRHLSLGSLNLSQLGAKISKWFGEEDLGIPEKSYFTSTLEQYGEQPIMADLFPYETYDPQTQLFRNQDSIGFVLETLPLTGASEEMQKEVSSLFQYILPEESSLQTILWADPHIGNLCDFWKEGRQEQNPVIQKLAERRSAFLKDMAWNRDSAGRDPENWGSANQYPYTLRNFRCFLAYSQPDCGNNPVAIESVTQILSQLKTALEMLRLPVTVWQPEDLINTVEGMVCLDPALTHARNRKWNPLDSIQSQITNGEFNLIVGANGLSLNRGKIKARTYKVRDYPEFWTLHAMGMLIGDAERDMAQIPCPFLIHYGVHVPKQDSPQKKVSSKAFYVEAQSQSPIAKYMPSVQREAAELRFVRENLAKGERIVQTSFTVILFAPQFSLESGTEELETPGSTTQGSMTQDSMSHAPLPQKNTTLPKAEQILKNLFQGQEWRLEPNRFLHLPMLLSCLPMSWGATMVKTLSNLKKLKTTQSTESSNLLPLQGEWHGTASPALILAGRRGQLFTWSPFDSPSNYNICVLGQSGAGKSVFMEEIVMGLLGLGGRIIVLDIGRSYQKLGQLLKAQFIRITNQSGTDTQPLSLNPFSDLGMGREHDQDYRNTLTMIKQVLISMLSPSGTLNDLENSYLEMALDAVTSHKGSETEVSDVAAWFLAHADPRVNDMGTRLYTFTKEGVFGTFFTGKSTISFTNPLIIVEFEDIKENKELSAVILQTLIANISNLVYRGDRKTKSGLVIDECWEFIKGKAGEALIEGASRTFRKYQWLLLMGSQNAEDFHKSLAAKAAFNNSAWKCYLSQPNEAFKAFEKEELITSPAMLNVLRTVKMNPGKYGEALIVSDSGYAVGRLLLDPFSLMLYSTKADEFSAVESLVNQGTPVEEAIDQLLETKRRKK
jgi:conjugal transfer ATP-binding protein TraC